ncbi:MAG: response regulator, partial [Candidatus Marinimicrobia bacterium]|nr:response regulator [Candidatus Neomarinimicrobiota bacterium]
MKILLIDDDSNDRMLTVHELNKNFDKIEITEIWNRKQFDEILHNFSFDLVITDYFMPGWDGIYVLKAVKALSTLIPVIMYTGTGNEEIAVNAMKLGLDDYILKGKARIVRLSTAVKTIFNHVDEVDARKRVEQALMDSVKQIYLLLDSTAEGIYAITLDGTGTLVNNAAMKMLGIESKEDFLKKNVHNLIHHTNSNGDHISYKDCFIHKAMSEKGYIHKANEIFWRTDNTCFPVEYWAYPIRERGIIIGSVVTFFDITDKIDSQQKLNEALVKTEQAVLVKNNFLANISHEIRTPLNAIIGFSDVLSKVFESRATEEENSYFQIINQACERLMVTVHQILDISTIEAGAYEIYFQELDLTKLANDIIAKTKSKAVEKGIPVYFKSNIKKATIHADNYCILQTLENLIDNAIKYT